MQDFSWEPWIEDMRRIEDSLNDLLAVYEEDPRNKEISQKLKIELHSMKGLMDAVGFNTATETVVEIEEIVHSRGDEVDEDLMEIIMETRDKINALLRILESGEDLSVSEIDKKIGFESLLLKAGRTLTLEIEIDEKRSMMSSRALSIINSIKKIAVIESTTPSNDDLLSDAKFDILKVEITTHEGKDEVKEQVENIQKVKSVTVYASEEAETTTGEEELYLRVKLKDVREIGDDLTILTGQLSQLESDLSPKGMDVLNSIYNSIENIQDDLRRLRSVPLIQIFSGLPGMVGRIAKQEKKLVEFSMQGRFIRVDKLIANNILEPITQIIRNAVSHGIEPRNDRRKLKKNPIGLITLTASEIRDKVIIKITDDGAGIDVNHLKKRAKELKISVSKDNPFDIIFENKFTTGGEDASISGRGIGLYTAKKRIQMIGGSISVRSEPGKGTTFTLEIPNTDSLLKSVIVRSGDMKFAVSTYDIEHLEVMTEVGESYHFIDRDIPVVRISDILSTKEDKLPQQILLVCRGSSSYYALVVDEVLDERLASIRPLNPLLSNLKLFDGTLFDENQEPILVLNTSALA